MKLTLFTAVLLFCNIAKAQFLMGTDELPISNTPELTQNINLVELPGQTVKLQPVKWKMTGNRWLTGGLVFLAGASKGFNETLQFHWKAFRHAFPDANPDWFNPAVSWRNKYKNGDPDAGPKFPLSTSLLVAFTDQYHLNTLINRAAWTSVVVIKIGENKKPWKHYLLDLLYYTACHQAGFALTYYPFSNYKGN
jgi:hypothetical protein